MQAKNQKNHRHLFTYNIILYNNWHFVIGLKYIKVYDLHLQYGKVFSVLYVAQHYKPL